MILRCSRTVRRLNSSLIKVNIKDEVATLELNNPPVNILTRSVLEQFPKAFEEAENQGAEVIVIKSAKPGVYSAGLDISELYKPDESKLRSYSNLISQFFLTTWTSKLPVIAGINGASPAGGCVLACCSDYRIMVDHPKFKIGLNEVKMGLSVPANFSGPMASLIGQRRAEYACQTAKMFSGKEALEWGLIDELVSMEDFDSAIEKEVENWKGLPIEARYETKQILRKPITDAFLQTGRPLAADNIVRQMNDPKIQKILGMYIAAMKNKS